MDILISHAYILIAGYIALGCAVGFFAGLLGIGGGILLVPGLYYLQKHFGGTPENYPFMSAALATSMAVIIPTGISSSIAQIKRGAVRWDAIRAVAPGLILGVSLGIMTVTKIENETLRYIFAGGLYILALMMVLRREGGTPHPILLKPYIAVPAASGIGFIATLMGIGGAVLNVPYLGKAGVPLHNAIASSSILGVVVAVPAAIGYVITGPGHIADGNFGYVNIYALLCIAPLSVIIAPYGVKLSHKLPVKQLKRVFAGLLLLLATKMLFET